MSLRGMFQNESGASAAINWAAAGAPSLQTQWPSRPVHAPAKEGKARRQEKRTTSPLRRVPRASRLQRVVGTCLHIVTALGPRTTEKQDVAVPVFEFESTQAIMRVLEWFRKLDVARGKLRG